MNRRSDPRFDDGVPARSDFRDAAARRGATADDRKTAQLCAQVRRALDLAFLGVCADPVLQDVEVLDVSPAPDASRLRVRVGAGTEVGPRLEQARGLLTAEVAAAIRRRKVPELVFEVVLRES
jgi:ribosome-binding factor A